MMGNEELPIVQRMYDLIVWYVPVINKFPRSHKYVLGERMQTTLYSVLEGLVVARFRRSKLEILEQLNARLNVLRYQTRLCRQFELIDTRRYEHASRLTDAVGQELGGWIKQRRTVESAAVPATPIWSAAAATPLSLGGD